MSNKESGYLGKFLNACELLQSRGIKCVAWEEWEKISKVIPKTGQKLYEPSESWLEHKTIENGIKIRKELLSLEKVDRSSQLAVAEWLPFQKKAKVIKKSGQDWTCFGHEINSVLYLIPEEALLLLEMNNLELYWNGLPLSIQQAYVILFDSNNSEYTIDHYKVYSHLVKQGYRLQRYSRKGQNENRHSIGKKVIVEPENGLRLTKSQSNSEEEESKQTEGKLSFDKKEKVKITQENKKDCTEIIGEVQTELKNVNGGICMESIDNTINTCKTNSQINDIQTKSNENNLTTESHCSNSQIAERKKNFKVEIISDETVLGNIKIIKNANDTSTVLPTIPKWPGSRIQRNVKLLPKRNGKPFQMASIEPGEITVTNNDDGNAKQSQKRSISSDQASTRKKVRQEIIDISDDEIEEIPRPMTRMEILNLLPNIAAHSVTITKISRGYIPHSIKPQKDIYQYGRYKWPHIHKMDSQTRMRCIAKNDRSINVSSNTSSNSTSDNNTVVQHQTQSTLQINQFANRKIFQSYRSFGFISQDSRIMHEHSQFTNWYGRNTFIHQNVCQFNQRNMWGLDIQSTFNTNAIFGVMQNIMRSIHMSSVRFRNPFQANFQQNVQISYPQNIRQYMPSIVFNRNAWNGALWRPQVNYQLQRNAQNAQKKSSDIIEIPSTDESISSYINLPNVSSWTELKGKWQEEKTITIDDEESTDTVDNGEVQVVEQTKPLLKIGKVMNSGEIYEQLEIIKSAPERSVRQKKKDYVLSYNVYSNTKPYKKGSPGNPICRLLVIRDKNDRIFDVTKLSRLQDAKDAPIIIAYVASTAISYLQLGFVSVPNIY